jgi:hypothetical protein
LAEWYALFLGDCEQFLELIGSHIFECKQEKLFTVGHPLDGIDRLAPRFSCTLAITANLDVIL